MYEKPLPHRNGSETMDVIDEEHLENVFASLCPNLQKEELDFLMVKRYKARTAYP